MSRSRNHSTATLAEPGMLAQESGDLDRLYRKITLRLMPLLFLCYLFAFLDRINIGYAKLEMSSDLGFSEAVYGLGAGIFFFSYLLFEVPSNLLLERIGVRLTLLRILVLWGITSAATMFVTSPTQFYVARFLLGVFEGGFFPGIILYLTYWFPSARRGLVTGMFMFAVPIAGIIGGPISGTIMTLMDGAGGMRGWQWMFLLEGIPSVLLGLVCYFYLADKPANAKWLSAAERERVLTALAADKDASQGSTHGHAAGQFRKAVTDRRVWIIALIYFSAACANYAFTFWLPTMIKSLGVGSLAQIGWYSAIPYLFAGCGVLGISWSSDRFRERRWHVGGSLIVSAAAFSLTTFTTHSLAGSIALLCIVGFFEFGAAILFWAIPPTYLSKEAAPVGIAMISSIGVIGGFVSPTLLGFIKTQTGSLDYGIYAVSGIMVIGGLITLLALPSNALKVGNLQE
jgi:D-galactonate transporter